jgi:methyltransferase (TIGR00027 family)
MAEESLIENVSDTALWVASYRVQETRRKDAAFRDPLASTLAGDRGRRIARSMPRSALVGWGVVLRTSAIDRLILAALETGIDTVLNLGAGLDTRPYRMALPPQLRWIEVDLANILELKNSKLAGHESLCKVERIAADLSNRASREALFARYAASARGILVITEGVIPFFSNDDVAALARDLSAIASVRFWIQDFDNAGKRPLPKGWVEKLRAAPYRFKVADWFEFFKLSGWRPNTLITSAQESERIDRPYPWDFPYGLIMRMIPRDMRQRILSLSGAVMMEKIPV